MRKKGLLMATAVMASMALMACGSEAPAQQLLRQMQEKQRQ